MQPRTRKLSESRSAFPGPRNTYKKRESGLYAEALRLLPWNGNADWPASIDSELQPVACDHPELRFNDEDGLVLFDRSAEHHLFLPFLAMLLRQYRDRSESRAMVREWMRAPDSSSPLGFDSLCAYLDLDAEYVRDGLTRWMNKVDRGLTANPVAPFSTDLNRLV